MKGNRELFEDWFKTTDFYKNMIKSLIDHDYHIGALDRIGRKYKSIYVQLAFESWQAATQREGFKFMSINPTRKMIVAIENKVEQQLEASAITQDPFRLDGENIFEAMIGAVDD